MKSIERMIRGMEAKGIANARAVVDELVSGGALTEYDAAKYLAREEVLLQASTTPISTARIVAEVAYVHCIGESTLKRALGIVQN